MSFQNGSNDGISTVPSEPTKFVRIAELDPGNEIPFSSSIKAVVSLIWPYSSLSLSIALLLAEPDFRLRRNGGQIRVQFRGPCARAVSRFGIGTGEEVVLSLAGASWAKKVENVTAPGNSVAGELSFENKLFLQVYRENQEITLLEVDEPPARTSSPPPLPLTQVPETPDTHAPATPLPKRPHSPPDTWSSPAFLKRSRISGSALDSTSRFFLEDDDYVGERQRKRARFSGASGQWRLTSDITSDGEQNEAANDISEINASEEGTLLVDNVTRNVIVGSPSPSPSRPLRAEYSSHVQGELEQQDGRHPRPTGVSEEPSASMSHLPINDKPQTSGLNEKGNVNIPLLQTQPIQSESLSVNENPVVTEVSARHQTDQIHTPSKLHRVNGQPMQVLNENFTPKGRGVSLGETPSLHAKLLDSRSERERDLLEKHTTSKSVTDEAEAESAAAQVEGVHENIGPGAVSMEETVQQESPSEKLISAVETHQEASQSHREPDDAVSNGLTGSHQGRDLSSPSPSGRLTHEPFNSRQSEIMAIPTLKEGADHQPSAEAIQSTGLAERSELASQDHSLEYTDQISKKDFVSGPRAPHAQSAFNQAEAEQNQLATPPATQKSLEMAVDQAHAPVSLDWPLSEQVHKTSQGAFPSTRRWSSEASPLPISQKFNGPEGANAEQARNERAEGISPWFASREGTQKASLEVPNSSEQGQGESKAEASEKLEMDQRDEGSSKEVAPVVDQPDDQASSQEARRLLSALANRVSEPTGLRTQYSYFAPLSAISSHYGSEIDVIAVVTLSTTITRAKSGQKDFYLTLRLSDPSSFPTSTVVQLFRPFKQALPLATLGDVVLLRNVVVKSHNRKPSLVSGPTSAWAVYKNGDVEINGPPVEYGTKETDFANSLGEWWSGLAEHIKQLMAANSH